MANSSESEEAATGKEKHKIKEISSSSEEENLTDKKCEDKKAKKPSAQRNKVEKKVDPSGRERNEKSHLKTAPKKPSDNRKMEETLSSSKEKKCSPDVTFGWVKMTLQSRFQPAFIFPEKTSDGKNLAQYIQSNGDLSDYKHPVEVTATDEEIVEIKKSKKAQNYLKALKIFNAQNNTNY
ncbi:hypothetical protein Bhyg_02862 [Pseudolycoriella hygida]|uniref:Uncharacterized protein n=1 Tax=Pseudolycoriella hygida TaxID=35572 RepID=A0A9Q0NCB9_9DIPT|nr:hypothetical protein Bhyg_02862 [Pseudolycoriella hygida]